MRGLRIAGPLLAGLAVFAGLAVLPVATATAAGLPGLPFLDGQPQKKSPLTREEFDKKIGDFLSGKLQPLEFIKISGDFLEKAPPEDLAYTAYIHTMRGNAFSRIGNQRAFMDEMRRADALNLRNASATAVKPVADMPRAKEAVNAPALWRSYEDNALAAEENYQDKEITVYGRIRSVERRDGVAAVLLEAGENPPDVSVICFFPESALPDLVKIRRGQLVNVKGLCKGREGNTIRLFGAALVNPAAPADQDEGGK